MRRARGSRNLLASLVGLVAGAAAASGAYWLRQRGHFGGSARTDREAERLETDVVDALCADEVTGDCPIDVALIGRGIIELSGTVPHEAASERAAEVAQRVPGVHTVVNRLAVEMLERHMEETRQRHDEGAPDPPRPDDWPAATEDVIGQNGRVR